MNLLIVDDETTTRNGLIRHVNWSSFGIQNIELAASGMEALERCSSFAPDIILSDIGAVIFCRNDRSFIQKVFKICTGKSCCCLCDLF